MEHKNKNFRHIFLFYFSKGKNAAQAAKKFRDVLIADEFRFGDFSHKDEQRSGRPNEVDDDQIKVIIESDHYVIVREIEEMLKMPKSTINRHIQRLGLVKKLDIWIPHELKEIHLTKRINVCDLHLKRSECDPFLKRIITCDEKRIVCNNVVRKRSWSNRDEPSQTTSEAESHQKKDYAVCLVGLDRWGTFRVASKEPND